MVLAIVHIVRACVASFAFGIFVLLVRGRDRERLHKRRLQDILMALGVPVGEVAPFV